MDSMKGLTQSVNTEGHAGYLLFNSLPWAREEVIEIDEEESKSLIEVQIPAMGYTFIRSSEIPEKAAQSKLKTPITASRKGASTPFYELEWNSNGQMTRIYDKVNDRDVLLEGEVGNRLDVHEDKPADHDAWDIDIFYLEKTRHIEQLKSVEVVECGSLRAVIRFVWTYGNSEIRQNLMLYTTHPRIDFITEVSWHEPQQLLKVAFPVNIRSTTATYEIQYGNVQRPTHWNTSWDYARFETCAQRWIDLSERDYGVSLLNDCKYGHDVVEQTMRLTLIKSAISPDAAADIGEHSFTYLLLPHAGDWFTAGTQMYAQRLNTPIIPMRVAKDQQSTAGLPQKLSFFTCECEHVSVDTIKRAEDTDDWIVRCYEYGGKRGKAHFRSYFAIEMVEEVNLMEREAEAIQGKSDHFTAFFKPYELKTFRIKMKM